MTSKTNETSKTNDTLNTLHDSTEIIASSAQAISDKSTEIMELLTSMIDSDSISAYHAIRLTNLVHEIQLKVNTARTANNAAYLVL